MQLVRIGKVVRAIGLEGFLGIAGSEGGLANLKRIALKAADGEPELKKVLRARAQGRLWAVEIDGIDDRTAAERMVGREVFAIREDLGEAGEGLHYWGDLEGLAVETKAGQALGSVVGLIETGGTDVLVVSDGSHERLIPLAPYVTVDRAAAKVVVDPPEGLLDLGGPEQPGDEGPEQAGEGGPKRPGDEGPDGPGEGGPDRGE
ncbi:MAG TPA: ribosome maturation factor RimM [Anaeromyxobacteraceae bacterium]|nr:ribosome maturation factor RimM [Anaeromyxobacteraceae bacterium]